MAGGKGEEEKESDNVEYAELFSLAFFVANFNYTKEEYEKLTIKERKFILKAWENKVIFENHLDRNAVSNAYINANRKKGTKSFPLWKKAVNKNIDIKKLKTDFREIEKMENEDGGKKWVQAIYAAHRKG